ncbi:MAG: hypothetical protein KKG99_06755 [Bacteroidetes bacterium]|nr:hypothetical protein [Bacteroidota bacterium]
MDTIKEIMKENAFVISIYALLTTLIIVIIAVTNNKRKKWFIDWKKDTLNLYVFKREWERNDDKFMELLFSENEKLSAENKILKKDINKVSILFLIILIVPIIYSKFTKKT